MEETNIIYLIEIDSMVHDSIGLVASRSSLNKSIVSLCLSMLRTDTRRHSRHREFLVHRSRFLAALKNRLGLILTQTGVMRVMINALRVTLAVLPPIPQCLSLLSLVPAW